jgi:ADP-ribosylglycohydrolase
MRAAPIGLYGWRLKLEPREIFRLGTALGALTHGHPTGSLTSGALAVLISFLLDDVSLPDALSRTKCLLREAPAHEETLRAIERAEDLAASRSEPGLAIARIGEGWIAEEALAVSIYCALVATDFRQGVILAVNHDGDSDSTGSITGNLLGATHGIKAIPAGWLEQLELRLVISTVAEDLFQFPTWLTEATPEHAAEGKLKCKRYPG